MYRAAVALDCEFLKYDAVVTCRSCAFVPFFIAYDRHAEPPAPPRPLALSMRPGRVMAMAELLPCGHALRPLLPPGSLVDPYAIPNLSQVKEMLQAAVSPDSTPFAAGTAKRQFTQGIDRFTTAVKPGAGARFVEHFLELPGMTPQRAVERLAELRAASEMAVSLESRGFEYERNIPGQLPRDLVCQSVRAFPQADDDAVSGPAVRGVTVKDQKRLATSIASVLAECHRQQLPVYAYGNMDGPVIAETVKRLHEVAMDNVGFQLDQLNIINVTGTDGFKAAFPGNRTPKLVDALATAAAADPAGEAAALCVHAAKKNHGPRWDAQALAAPCQYVLPPAPAPQQG